MVTEKTDGRASHVEAFAHLCVDHAFTEENRRRIAQAAWIGTRPFVMSRMSDMDVDRLDQLAETLRDAMTRHKLTDEHRMLPVLWIRLFIEAGLPIEEGAFSWLKALRPSAEGRRPCLYQVKVRKAEQGQRTDSWTGPEVAVEGLKPARGYSFEELLLGTFKKSPYARTWRIVELAPTESSANGSARRQKSSASSKPARSGGLPRKRPSKEKYDKAFGSVLLLTLRGACAREAERPKGSMLTKGSPSGRPYLTDRPAKDVISRLRESSTKLRSYSVSTLRSGLRLWVECPRGRPSMDLRPAKRAKTR